MIPPRRAMAAGVFALSAALLPAPAAHAGTVITTNLPTSTAILNIDARSDGAAAFSQPNPPQAYWYQPTATAPSITLAAGTYTFRIINPTDAASLYSRLTNAQLSQIYTGWTYNSPWIENYMVFRSTALLNPNESQIFDGALAPGVDPYGSAQAAYDATVANGYYNKIRPAPPGRAGGPETFLTSYTFTETTTLLFVIPDNALADNSGGVSVVVQAAGGAVPEPAGVLLLGLGTAGVAAAGWRRRGRSAGPAA